MNVTLVIVVDSKHPLYFAEDPLDKEDNDSFHHSEIVDVLEHAITRSSGSINIALYGGWGVGKSTIVNFLRKRINTKDELKDYQFVLVDAWKLSPEILRQELLEELASQLNMSEDEIQKFRDVLYNVRHVDGNVRLTKKAKIKDLFKRTLFPVYPIPFVLLFFYWLSQNYDANYLEPVIIGSVLVPISIFVAQMISTISKGMEATSKKIIPKAESSQQFKKLFDEIINAVKKPKLIIAVDNLDRCDEESTVKILGSIKTFMDNEKCIYIIPCDETALINHLKNKFGVQYDKPAKEFLRKFFQIIISIPPQIKGDLDTYVTNQMKKFSEIPFDEHVVPVLTEGVGKNPRKLRQYLYNLAILYNLADIRENIGENLTKYTITKHTGFLAKIIVIKEEWPSIFEKFEHDETLLKKYEQQLEGNADYENAEQIEEIEQLFTKNPDFKDFLRATSLATVDDPRPFIRFSQESFESLSSESDILYKKARSRDSDYVYERFKSLKPAEIENQAKTLLYWMNYYIDKINQYAYNIAHVVLEIYDLTSKSTKQKIITEFSKNFVNAKKLRESIDLFDVEKLFPLVMQMHPNSKNTLLMEYTRKISSRSPINIKAIEQFMQHSKELPQHIIEEFDDNVARVGGSNPPEFVAILEAILHDDYATNVLIQKRIMNELAGRIDTDNSEQNKKKIDIFLKLMSKTSFENKEKFVKRMFQIASNKEYASLKEEIPSWAIRTLYEIQESTLDKKLSSTLFNELKSFQTITEYDNAKILLPLAFKIINHLSNVEQESLVELFLPQALVPDTPNFIELIEYLYEQKIDVFSSELFFERMIEGFSPLLPQQELIVFLLTRIPENRMSKIISLLSKSINNSNENQINIFLTALNSENNIPKKFSNELLAIIIGRLDALGFQGAYPRLNDMVEFLSNASRKVTDLYADTSLSWIKDNNDEKRNRGVNLASQSFEHYTKTKKTDFINKIIDELKEQFSQENHARIQQILNMLPPMYVSFNSSQRKKLVELLLPQLKVERPPHFSIQALSALQEMKLEDDFEKVQKSILELRRKSQDGNVHNTCNSACEKLGMLTMVRSENFSLAGGTKNDGQMPKALAKKITVEADKDGVAYLQYHVLPNSGAKTPCSSIRIHVRVNDISQYESDWLWYFDAPEDLPKETDLIELEKLKPGPNEIVIQPEGRKGGCNDGFLGSYNGTITYYKKSTNK